jgi:rod shape-determining protein MreB
MTLSLDQLRRCTVAADLGAARTRVYLKQTGLIVDEPSVVAVNTRNGALIAVGTPAERMSGRTPANIRVIKPIIGGTVVDIDMAQRMLRAMVGTKLRRALRRRPMVRMAICMQHDADPLARRAAYETLLGLGARRVELVDCLIAAGIGAGLPVEQPEAAMIVQCGAATTQVAVLSLGSIVAAEKVPMGGETVDRALVQYLRNQHELLLPSQAVRPLHQALSVEARASAEVHGRDVATGLARTVRIDPASVRTAVRTPLTSLLDAIRSVLHRCPPDLVADLADHGLEDRALVLKPRRSGGTDDVHKVEAGQDWRPVFDRLLGSVNRFDIVNDTVLVQEFAAGTEYIVDTYSVDGQFGLVSVSRYSKSAKNDRIGIYDAVDYLEPDDPLTTTLGEYTRQVAQAVGIRNGCTHTEIMLTADGPRLIEIAARLAGSGLQHSARLATGDSQIDRTVRHHLDGTFTPSYRITQPTRVLWLSSPDAGTLADVEALDALQDLPTFQRLGLPYRNGDQGPRTEDLFTSLGWVILAGPSQDALDTDTARVRELEKRVTVMT